MKYLIGCLLLTLVSASVLAGGTIVAANGRVQLVNDKSGSKPVAYLPYDFKPEDGLKTLSNSSAKLRLQTGISAVITERSQLRFSKLSGIFLLEGKLYVSVESNLEEPLRVTTAQGQLEILNGKIFIHTDKQNTFVFVETGTATVVDRVIPVANNDIDFATYKAQQMAELDAFKRGERLSLQNELYAGDGIRINAGKQYTASPQADDLAPFKYL